MKSSFFLSILGFYLLATAPSSAQSPMPGAFSAPYVLMTPLEIEHLPARDRTPYLGMVRDILSQVPENLILAAKNECGETQKQCEPSLFGEHVCIAKHSQAHVECSKLINKEKDYSAANWGAYFHRLQSYCTDAKMPPLCRALEEKRIRVFQARRTH